MLNDFLSLSDGNVVSDFSAVFAVVHEEEVQVRNVGDTEFEETVGKYVLGFFVTPVTNLDLFDLRFVSSADARVDTSGFSPGGVSDANKFGFLVTNELEGSLFDNLIFDERSNHLE